jgi:uncharacterized protein
MKHNRTGGMNGWRRVITGTGVLVVLGVGLGLQFGSPRHESLYAAVESGDRADVRRHLQAGGDVNAVADQGWTALMMAAYRGDLRMVELLVSRGAQLDAQNDGGATALMVAIHAGEWKTVNELLSRGADVHTRTLKGRTPLMLAVRKGDLRMVESLLARGADARTCDGRGQTAWLEVARLEGRTGFQRPDIRECLARYGAEREAPGGAATGRKKE